MRLNLPGSNDEYSPDVYEWCIPAQEQGQWGSTYQSTSTITSHADEDIIHAMERIRKVVEAGTGWKDLAADQIGAFTLMHTFLAAIVDDHPFPAALVGMLRDAEVMANEMPEHFKDLQLSVNKRKTSISLNGGYPAITARLTICSAARISTL